MYKDLNLTKTKTKPLESVVKFFITLSAFAAILISIAIVFTLLTEAINFFKIQKSQLESILLLLDGHQHLKTQCMGSYL